MFLLPCPPLGYTALFMVVDFNDDITSGTVRQSSKTALCYVSVLQLCRNHSNTTREVSKPKTHTHTHTHAHTRPHYKGHQMGGGDLMTREPHNTPKTFWFKNILIFKYNFKAYFTQKFEFFHLFSHNHVEKNF